jgi:flagellar hook-associated protein 2
MSTGLSISGAVSGIDTATMINQLMSVEASQQNALKTRQSNAQKAADAYSSVISSLKDLATKAKALANTAGWQGSVATSSSESVKATASGTASGSLTFDVDDVAASHAIVSSDTVNSTGAIVASSGVLGVLDANGTEISTIDVGSGSLAEVVAAINNSATGLRASTVQTTPGNYRLQVTTKTSGAAGEFAITGLDGFAGVDILTQGADAKITVGSDPLTQYTITSSSNTFSGVIPGLSFTVSKEETNVTVEASVDGSKIADEVKSLVDAANGVLTTLSSQTAYNSSTKTGGALLGEGTIRNLQQQILSTVGGAGAPGVSLTRDGKLKFDAEKFTTAFEADPAKTASLYGASSTFSPALGIADGTALPLVRTATTAKAGNYAVQVAVTAAREQWRMDPPGGDIGGQTVVVMQGSRIVTYTAGVGESVADAVAAMNSQMSSSNLGVTAAVVGASVFFTASAAGTGSAFEVTMNGATATRTVAGRDVAGSIDGYDATGSGAILSLSEAASDANGLAFDTSAITDADVSGGGGYIGDVSYTPGLAQGLANLLDAVTDTRDGTLSRARANRQADVQDLQDSIDSWDRRLETRRAALTKQFTAMETAIAALKSQTSALSGLSSSSS